jgi:anaerobic selenocysteine-containing dehydrogenase
VPGFQGSSWATLLPDGMTWSAPRVAGSLVHADGAAAAPGEGLWLLSGGVLFAQGSLTARSATLAKLAGEARAFVAPAEASRLGLAAGDRVELAGPAGALALPVQLDDSVPPGAVFVPYAFAGAELNRLGAPSGAGLKVKLRKVAATAQVGA